MYECYDDTSRTPCVLSYAFYVIRMLQPSLPRGGAIGRGSIGFVPVSSNLRQPLHQLLTLECAESAMVNNSIVGAIYL